MVATEELLLPSQEALLQRLQHLACYGQQLVLLQGQAGAGKTRLLTALANVLDEHNLALVSCPQHADAAEIRRKLLIQLLPDPCLTTSSLWPIPCCVIWVRCASLSTF